MMLATVHYSPYWTIPASLLSAAGLIAYWIWLGSGNVPPSRRRIRRLSVAIMLLSLPVLVRGLSFVDRVAQPNEYIITWTVAMLMMLTVIAIACLDAFNSMQLHQSQTNEEVSESTRELQKALHRGRATRDWPREDSPNGKETRV